MRNLLKLFAVTLALPCLGAAADDGISFRKDIAPILLAQCQTCHGPDQAEGNYRVDSFARLNQAGDSGETPITPGHAAASELLRRLTSDDPDERMPSESDPLPAEQIATVRTWIAQGARFDADDPSATLALILPIERHPAAPEQYPYAVPIAALAFSDDGNQLFVGGYHEVTVWDTTDGKLLRRMGQIAQRIHSLVLDKDGRRLFVGGGNPGRLGEARVIDAHTGQLIQVPVQTSEVVLDIALSPQEDRLAVAGGDRRIHVVSLPDGQVRRTIDSHSDWVHAVDWDKQGRRLASASRDRTAKIFDMNSGKPVMTYSGHGGDVLDVLWSPDDEHVLSCAGKNVHLWKAEDGEKVRDFGVGERVLKLSAGPDSFFATSSDRLLRRFPWEGDDVLGEFAGHRDWVLSVTLDRSQSRVAAGSADGQVIIWNISDGRQIVTFVAAPGMRQIF